MDAPGAPAGPGGGDPASPAFYGLWPRMEGNAPPAGPRFVAVTHAGAAPAGDVLDGGARLA